MNDIKRDPAAPPARETQVEAAHSVLTTDTQDSADSEKTAKRAVKQEAKQDVKQLTKLQTKLQSKPQTKKTVKATQALKTAQAPVKGAGKPSLEHADKKVNKQAPKQDAKASKSKPASPSVARKATTQNDDRAKRAKKDKVIRDSFTMPKADYDKIATLKARCQANGAAIKKSELLRAGILLLDTLGPNALLSAVGAVETVKTGRPRRA